MKHTKTSTEVEKKQQKTPTPLNIFSAHLANTFKTCPSSFPYVTAAVQDLQSLQKRAVSNTDIYKGHFFKPL